LTSDQYQKSPHYFFCQKLFGNIYRLYRHYVDCPVVDANTEIGIYAVASAVTGVVQMMRDFGVSNFIINPGLLIWLKSSVSV